MRRDLLFSVQQCMPTSWATLKKRVVQPGAAKLVVLQTLNRCHPTSHSRPIALRHPYSSTYCYIRFEKSTCSMSLPVRLRNVTTPQTEDWELHKDKICHLWHELNTPIKQIADIMLKEHKFYATYVIHVEIMVHYTRS